MREEKMITVDDVLYSIIGKNDLKYLDWETEQGDLILAWDYENFPLPNIKYRNIIDEICSRLLKASENDDFIEDYYGDLIFYFMTFKIMFCFD